MPVRHERGTRPSAPTRIAVHSDDRLFCEGLLRILDATTSFLIVDYRAVDESRPQVILLDSRIDGALTLCTSVADRGSDTHVILIAASDDDHWAARALAAGARGILSRKASSEDLFDAIEEVRAGLYWASPRTLAARLDYLSDAHGAPRENEIERQLSVREREVFREAARGLGNKELADRLAISEATVKVHLTHIFQKLGVSGRAELAAAYYGIIPTARVPLIQKS
jgi:two-component system, NarL family, nitrate/nitrite response regulator NarL